MRAEPDERYTHAGWHIGSVHIHPVWAFTDPIYWFDSFEAKMPKQKERMRDYSKSKDWNRMQHRSAWFPVVIGWLNRKDDEQSGAG